MLWKVWRSPVLPLSEDSEITAAAPANTAAPCPALPWTTPNDPFRTFGQSESSTNQQSTSLDLTQVQARS
jgi:hypothetical protein